MPLTLGIIYLVESYEKNPPGIVSMQLLCAPPSGGDTVFASGYVPWMHFFLYSSRFCDKLRHLRRVVFGIAAICRYITRRTPTGLHRSSEGRPACSAPQCMTFTSSVTSRSLSLSTLSVSDLGHSPGYLCSSCNWVEDDICHKH
jgi:hypothetical protein